ncbi:MAG: rRNA maturation RNAse YbeY [Candidatus Liptonbacteria bacterium]|nr:rRNA maturation RNAse YbeY [Candidatus Liptonbacteria bacterium]
MKSVRRRLPGLVELHRIAALAMRELGITTKLGRPEIFLLRRKEMEALAAHFFRRPEQHANVLAFEADDFPHPAPRGQKFLGQIYLNQDLSNRSELLIHGLLHLLGYRHGRARDMIRMQRREKELRRLINDQ